MIYPTKYIDLDTCVLRIAALILHELRQSSAIPVDELDHLVRSNIGDSARFNFLSTLNFLFLLGQIDYDEKSDTIFRPSGLP